MQRLQYQPPIEPHADGPRTMPGTQSPRGTHVARLRVCALRIVTAKNSRKRSCARCVSADATKAGRANAGDEAGRAKRCHSNRNTATHSDTVGLHPRMILAALRALVYDRVRTAEPHIAVTSCLNPFESHAGERDLDECGDVSQISARSSSSIRLSMIPNLGLGRSHERSHHRGRSSTINLAASSIIA